MTTRSCSICMQVCRQTSTLFCQHTFCQECLSSYIKAQTVAVKTRSIPCPSCGQKTPVPNPQVHVGENTEAEPCSVCKEEGKTTPATFWCSECEASFCDKCFTLHRQMPNGHNHDNTEVVKGTERSRSRKRNYVCKQHNTNITLFCRNCSKPMCHAGCSADHRSCKDVVTLKTMLPEVKKELQNRQMKLSSNINDKTKKVVENKNNIKTLLNKTSKIKSEIQEVTTSIVDLLHRKQDELIKTLDNITEQKTNHLQTRVKSGEVEIQMYQQQAQFIQQILKIEDKAQLFEMYCSEAVTDVTDTQKDDVNIEADLSFIYNLEQLKDEIDKMNVRTVGDATDLTASPVLQEIIDTNVDETYKCNVTDVVRVKIEDMKVTVVTDSNNTVKSFYSKSGERLSSQLRLKNCPWSLSVLSQNKVVVSVPRSNQILTVGVNPDLELLSSLTTKKQYSGLAVLDQSTLVASCPSPPSVDVLDMAGHVLRCLSARPLKQQLFQNPQYLHVTSQGNILVSDYIAHSLVCVTQTGQVVFTYSLTNRALRTPRGITSTFAGDIFIADSSSGKVLHLSKSGQFIRDILTPQDGLQHPRGLCVDGDRLCVATRHRGVHVFSFSR